MKLGVVIPAAGRGSRMNTIINKQFLNLGDRPVLAHTLDKFYKHPSVEEMIVVTRRDEREYCRREIIDKYGLTGINLVAGGETRRESVFAGLMGFSLAIDYVIIHDGARPLLSDRTLKNVVEALSEYRAVTVGTRIKDTVKRCNGNNQVVSTLDRDQLVSIQTPQAFEYELIVRAHRQYENGKFPSLKVTDDASLVEALGQPVKVVEGSYENIKITTPVDLLYAKLILKNRED